jgi:hypothetical protein
MREQLLRIAKQALPKSLTTKMEVTKPTGFMDLPRELRQSVLFYTYDKDTFLHQSLYIDHFFKREKYLGRWMLTLRLLHPSLAEDVQYVIEKMTQSYYNREDELKKEFRYLWDNFDNLWAQEAKRPLMKMFYREMTEFGAKICSWEWEERHPVLKRLRLRKIKEVLEAVAFNSGVSRPPLSPQMLVKYLKAAYNLLGHID